LDINLVCNGIILIKAYADLAIPITVFVAMVLFYFILTVNHIRIFHLLLNGQDHFDIIPKGQRLI